MLKLVSKTEELNKAVDGLVSTCMANLSSDMFGSNMNDDEILLISRTLITLNLCKDVIAEQANALNEINDKLDRLLDLNSKD